MHVSPLVFDLETCGLDNAADYLEPVKPDARLKDPDKVKADIAEKTQARNEKVALDWNVGRIVALAWWAEDVGLVVRLCYTEDDERSALREFWVECRHRTLVGFAVKNFDLKYLVQRSRYLGVDYPILDLSKYSRKGITDLYLDLTFNEGTYDQGVMKRSLKAFCRRFGIAVDDAINGAEIPALVAAGEWDKVEDHVRSDVQLTLALARKLKVVSVEAAEAVL